MCNWSSPAAEDLGIIDRSTDEARPEFVSSVEGRMQVIKNDGPEEDNEDLEEFFF
jgi:hypothetical protein